MYFIPDPTNLVVHQDRLVHDLLELSVLQIASDHHLQHLKEFPVGNESIIVQIINPDIVQNSFLRSGGSFIYHLFVISNPL